MYTQIQLDKVRNLRYGMKSISLIEKTLNKNIMNLDLENLSMTDTATIIWAGLYHEDKDLTIDGVMDLIDDHSNLTLACELMAKAFGEAFNNGKTEKK